MSVEMDFSKNILEFHTSENAINHLTQYYNTISKKFYYINTNPNSVWHKKTMSLSAFKKLNRKSSLKKTSSSILQSCMKNNKVKLSNTKNIKKVTFSKRLCSYRSINSISIYNLEGTLNPWSKWIKIKELTKKSILNNIYISNFNYFAPLDLEYFFNSYFKPPPWGVELGTTKMVSQKLLSVHRDSSAISSFKTNSISQSDVTLPFSTNVNFISNFGGTQAAQPLVDVSLRQMVRLQNQASRSKNSSSSSTRLDISASLQSDIDSASNRLKAKQQASHSKNLENNFLSRSNLVNSTKYSTQSTLVTKRIDEMHLCSLNCNNFGDMHSPISKNVGNNFLYQSNRVNINYTDYDNSVLSSINNNIIINHDVNQTPHSVAEVSLQQLIRQQHLLANRNQSTQSTLVTKRTDEMHSSSLNCNNFGDMHSPISKNVGNNFLYQSNCVNINCTDYDNSVLSSINNNIIINHDVNQTPHSVAEVSLQQLIRQQHLLANRNQSTQSTLVTKRTDEMHSSSLNCNNSSDMHSPIPKNAGNNFLSQSNSDNISCTDYDCSVLTSAYEETIRDRVKMKAVDIFSLNREEYPEDSASYIKQFGRF
jgi:hypothetical protein